MTVQSKIEIPVDDSQFERFKQLFDQYTATLAKTPKLWANVSKEQQLIAEHFEKQTAALMAQNQIAREDKERKKRELEQLTSSEKLW